MGCGNSKPGRGGPSKPIIHLGGDKDLQDGSGKPGATPQSLSHHEGVPTDNTPDSGDTKSLRIKLVLLGDSGVGKSCIVLRFVRGQFDASSKVTVGASFLSQTVTLQDTTVKFEIWDTAGQERYASLAPLYYRGASAATVVYDIANVESFQKAKFWVKELQKHGSPGIVMALVGNKADLFDDRKVNVEEAQAYADQNGMFFIETSAKTDDNIKELFESIARRLPRGPGTTPTPTPTPKRVASRG